jgi:predicted MFS family arabinose efflux permease
VTDAHDARTVTRTRWALLGGNFAIACGVMAPSGVMNDLVDSLQVSPAVAGQLITIGAVVLAVCAPLLAAWVERSPPPADAVAAWYAVGHGVAALSPTVLPSCTVTLSAPRCSTPQASAASDDAAHTRGHAITLFSGWAVARCWACRCTPTWQRPSAGAWHSAAWPACRRRAWVWQVIPMACPAALGAQWRSVLTDPVLMAVVMVTALAGAAQFTLFSYMAPYFRQVLGATPAQIAMLFLVFGAVGLASSVVVTRVIDRLGAPRMVALLLAGMALSFALWPFVGSVAMMALAILPWSFGCFAAQSSQHARLSSLAPMLAPASMRSARRPSRRLAVGAATGGAMLAVSGFSRLAWAALAWVLVAIALSQWAAARRPHAGDASCGMSPRPPVGAHSARRKAQRQGCPNERRQMRRGKPRARAARAALED